MADSATRVTPSSWIKTPQRTALGDDPLRTLLRLHRGIETRQRTGDGGSWGDSGWCSWWAPRVIGETSGVGWSPSLSPAETVETAETAEIAEIGGGGEALCVASIDALLPAARVDEKQAGWRASAAA